MRPVSGRAALPLTPLLFLDRAARMFAERAAVIEGGRTLTYRALHALVGRQRAALRELGIGPGDRVAVLAPNTSGMLQMHYAVPGVGAVLVALNVRLSVPELDTILTHAGASLLLFDPSLAATAARLATPARRVLSLPDLEALAVQQPGPAERAPVGELDLLALNYTSGTTGRPKGVMYQHRGAYLQSLAMALHARLGPGSVHLWTLPMFHCNGWCFTWAVTAAGGTHVCLPRVEPQAIWSHLRDGGVTQLNAAPTVLSMLAWDAAAEAGPPPAREVLVCTGGAPPTPALLERLEELRFTVRHLYGLTETYGPIIACDWQPEWDGLDAAARARHAARQGNANVLASEVRIADPAQRPVADDGVEQGEVQVRGNNVMLGYYDDPEATAEAFAPGGWFRTGDLGVMHPDGYVELRDRAKDIIISGGENIASIEVEQAIATHPAVLEVAVVAQPDAHWGEIPVAFVALKPGHAVEAEELIELVRTRLARFKAPRRVVFGDLPRTATGKVQKFALRERARGGSTLSDNTTPLHGGAS